MVGAVASVSFIPYSVFFALHLTQSVILFETWRIAMKEIGISEFKAKCVDELKKVQRTGEPLLVTLNKRPIATVNPYREESRSNRELGKLRGRMTIHGDIVHTDFGDEWEMNS